MKQIQTPLDFSIVIPALNEETYLPKLLKDLCKQTFHAEHFEVIVIDGHSTDQTVKKARSFADQLQIRVEVAPKPGVARQRNFGTKLSRAPWVIFMDADNRIPASFLDGIKYQLAQTPTADCFTCWLDETTYKTADRPLVTMINLTIEVFAKVRPGAPGAMIGAMRTLALKFPFDESLAMSEDHEFVGTLVEQGYDFVVFRTPKYTYSFRRLESEGTLKLARTYAKAQLYLLTGRKLKEGSVHYPMGGSFHLGTSPLSKTMLKVLKTNFSDLVKNHKQTALKILNRLNNNQGA